MTFTAFLLIFLSATFHATWNLLAKKDRMTVPFYMLICLSSALVWCHVQFWTPVHVFALPGRFWGIMAASVASDCLYCFGLMMVYRRMEMSSAYPVMRSLPVLLTLLFTGLLGWGTPLSALAKLGVFVLFCGCLLMPLRKFSDFHLREYLSVNFVFLLLAALGTTGYTIFDSQAQKVLAASVTGISKPVLSLTYYSTRGICLTSTLVAICLFTPGDLLIIRDYWRRRDYLPLLSGLLAGGTYILVLMAMNYVTNVSYVQVFRQLGLPIGMFFGILFLHEKGAATKYLGIVLILLGLFLTLK